MDKKSKELNKSLDMIEDLLEQIKLHNLPVVKEVIDKAVDFLEENNRLGIPPGLFRVIDDTTNTYPLGGDVTFENAYISMYPKVISGKSPKRLEIGESCICEYNLAGSSTTYRILRVE